MNEKPDPWIKTPSTAAHQRIAVSGGSKIHVKAPYSGRAFCGRVPSRLLGNARPENADNRWCGTCLAAWRARLCGVWRGPETKTQR